MFFKWCVVDSNLDKDLKEHILYFINNDHKDFYGIFSDSQKKEFAKILLENNLIKY